MMARSLFDFFMKMIVDLSVKEQVCLFLDTNQDSKHAAFQACFGRHMFFNFFQQTNEQVDFQACLAFENATGFFIGLQ